jgi:uncharacterized protein (DUF4213/DUF364 family)
MSFYTELLELLELAAAGLGRLTVSAVDLPAAGRAAGRDADFGSVILSDGSVGLFYAWLDGVEDNPTTGAGVVGRTALDSVHAMIEGATGARAFALGIANAMGQAVFRAAGWRPPAGRDTLSELGLAQGDRIGMVGYFPSLVPRLQALQLPLLVVEKRRELARESGSFAVTTDLARLSGCNKVICTGSVLLNDTVDEVLEHCRQADRVIMVGPSVACLPDPLFQRGCDVVGSTEVIEPALLREHLRCGRRWGGAVRKYRIDAAAYPGTPALVQRIQQAADARLR